MGLPVRRDPAPSVAHASSPSVTGAAPSTCPARAASSSRPTTSPTPTRSPSRTTCSTTARGLLPRQGERLPRCAASAGCCARPGRSPSTATPSRPPTPSVRPSTGCARARPSRSSPRARSPATPTSGRCGARPGRPGSPSRRGARSSPSRSGARRRSSRPTATARRSSRARRCMMYAGPPVDLDRPLRPADRRDGAARGDRPAHGPHHRAARGGARARAGRPSGSTRARHGVPEIGDPLRHEDRARQARPRSDERDTA